MATNPVDIEILERIEADLSQLRKNVLNIQQSSADIAGMVRRMDGKLSALLSAASRTSSWTSPPS